MLNNNLILYATRSQAKMNAMRAALIAEKGRKGFAKIANAKAKLLGVNLDFENPWHISRPDEWVFGPDQVEDNIYRCLPQVNLHGMDEGLTQKLNLGILLHASTEVGTNEYASFALVVTFRNIIANNRYKFTASTKGMKLTTFCREVDMFFRNVALEMPRNINVEMGERDGLRGFPHGVTGYVLNKRRIDGGWHISIARQFRIFLCTTSLLTPATKKMFAKAYSLLLQVHASLRIPLLKTNAAEYQIDINELLQCMKIICAPFTKKGCNSAKYHLPYHWLYTRIQNGCSANEKSLERKLGEAQKKFFPLTNGKSQTQVPFIL